MAGMAQHNNVLKTDIFKHCIVKCTNLLVISIVLNYSSSPKHDFHIFIQWDQCLTAKMNYTWCKNR